MVNPAARHVHITGFPGQSDVIAYEPISAGINMQIKFESAAHVRWANTGGRDAGAAVQEGNQASPRSEVVSQMRREADYVFARGPVLSTTPQFQAAFKIAAVPMPLTQYMAEHVSIGKAEQREVMCLPAAEGCHARGNTNFNGENLRRGEEALSDIIFPDSRFRLINFGFKSRR